MIDVGFSICPLTNLSHPCSVLKTYDTTKRMNNEASSEGQTRAILILTENCTHGQSLFAASFHRFLIPEILILVFGHLSKADLFPLTTVCHGWSELALNGLWQDATLFPLLKTLAPLAETDCLWVRGVK